MTTAPGEMIPEGVFQRALEVKLNEPKRATRVRRLNAGKIAIEDARGQRRVFRGAAKGTGDLAGYVIGPGWHLEVECKTEVGRLSPAQRRRGVALARAGAIYVLVRPLEGESLDEAVARSVREVDAAIEARRRSACR